MERSALPVLELSPSGLAKTSYCTELTYLRQANVKISAVNKMLYFAVFAYLTHLFASQ
jgi:hypothetical protein